MTANPEPEKGAGGPFGFSNRQSAVCARFIHLVIALLSDLILEVSKSFRRQER